MEIKDYTIGAFFYSLIHSKTNKITSSDKYSVAFKNVTSKCLNIIGEKEKAYSTIMSAEQSFFNSAEYIPTIELYYRKATIEKDLFEDDRYLESLRNVKFLVKLSKSDELSNKFDYHIKYNFKLSLSEL